ncbi:MAG: DUF2254 domain-containing protein [Trueperaceae bacterium]
MTVRVRQWLETLAGSYWFVPMLLGVAAVGLSFLTLQIDQNGRMESLIASGLLTANGPDGARSLLSTVAGSIITVAGVIFSLTMVVLTQASSQFGPRLLVNFMHDRTNQIVLGMFVATFVYSLLVLRVVRAGDADLGVAEFVPHLSIGVALLLTFVNAALLVYFFHHTAEGVRVSHVLAGISRVIERRIEQETVLADDAAPAAEMPPGFGDDVAVLDAPMGGVLQSVDVAGLVALAHEHDAVIRLLHMPGTFVWKRAPYAEVHPASAAGDVEEGLSEYLSLGEHRSLSQDLGFLFDELLEVGVRALSPSMNDPFTAINCIDRITQGLLLLDGRHPPHDTHADEDGVARAVVPLQSRVHLTRHLFSELRPHVVGDLMVTARQLEALRTLVHEVSDPALAQAAEAEFEALLATARGTFPARDFASLPIDLDATQPT